MNSYIKYLCVTIVISLSMASNESIVSADTSGETNIDRAPNKELFKLNIDRDTGTMIITPGQDAEVNISYDNDGNQSIEFDMPDDPLEREGDLDFTTIIESN